MTRPGIERYKIRSCSRNDLSSKYGLESIWEGVKMYRKGVSVSPPDKLNYLPTNSPSRTLSSPRTLVLDISRVSELLLSSIADFS